MTSRVPPGLARLNSADEQAVAALLHEVCAAEPWIAAVAAGRPYPDPTHLYAAAAAALAALDDAGLAEAMAGHPPIGRPAPGDPASAREQRGVAGAPEELRAELRELNLAYQERFGHVFLICATGLGAVRMRDALRARLGNAPEREREIARGELGKINRIRLTRLVEAEGA
ncbi:2-oxo-4-hydroxy-4-carboxy-5-ureidoimidazoline decarboxylase [Streptomyces sp. NBC_01808]|uniref:2-oxo-4-hydroxy-4-carboxy-5-ureidoimidazoline decarboxylase n=1 Tax=Streptomyces sp. NBC_01808 TaxID=2975947 RepID=UPI002DD93F35|nr:2-oxo-4-hydroxy-4-carboxy-5-ureidoimidazoline decarboxylase [Streptomyces sp. NBC_01808]WSA41382.1 2-oxo-4-hydroxy-4-carboxy-5-ureidoimidazoline decarboxylase [Streptomyces sp. NBC_01808]